MSSIRLFLIIALIATITLVSFVSSLQGYRRSMQQAEHLFDQQLRDYVGILAALPAFDPRQDVAPAAVIGQLAGQSAEAASASMVFQVWRQPAQLLARSDNAPNEPLSAYKSGFYYLNYAGYRWRALGYALPERNLWIIAAERDDLRYSLAEGVVLESVYPTVLGLPVAALMIWMLVGYGLGPLKRLAAALRDKQASDLSPIRLDGVPRELMPLSHSINELLARLESSFMRERRLSADAAHELRTPISALKVHIDNLLAENHYPSTTLDRLGEDIERLGHLVEQMLMLNRTVPDHFVANFQIVDLHGIAQQVITLQYNQMQTKSQHVALEGERALVRGDQFALQTLLENLVSNASKYTPVGGQILLRTSRRENKSLIEVIDSGQGIPKDQYERVFERFYRIGGDCHASGEPGCGLGLAIVKHIVDLHGAKILLGDSPLGSGLSVTVVFADD